MRTLGLTTLGLISALSLGACASTGSERTTSATGYSGELAKLQSQCDARGGMLVPTGRLSGAQPQLDYACDIRSGGNRTR
jgi:hypothetical protein